MLTMPVYIYTYRCFFFVLFFFLYFSSRHRSECSNLDGFPFSNLLLVGLFQQLGLLVLDAQVRLPADADAAGDEAAELKGHKGQVESNDRGPDDPAVHPRLGALFHDALHRVGARQQGLHAEEVDIDQGRKGKLVEQHPGRDREGLGREREPSAQGLEPLVSRDGEAGARDEHVARAHGVVLLAADALGVEVRDEVDEERRADLRHPRPLLVGSSKGVGGFRQGPEPLPYR